MKISRLALFTASVLRAERKNALSTWTPRSLANLDIGMGVSETAQLFKVGG